MADTTSTTVTAPKPAHKRILHNLRNISRDEIKELLLYFAVTLSLFLVGHFHFSFAWIIMILMVFVSWEYQMDEKNKRRDRMEKALKSSFIDKIENLPSWVYFPEKEQAEWVNSIIDQMWPYVDGMVYKILKETVEPEMQKNMPKALNTLYFETIDLGNKPPYVANVKSYPSKEERKSEFIFDMDIVYNGDATIKLAVKKVKLGLSNIELRGVLRVIFNPLVAEYNPVGGVTVFFLNRPKLKFDLTNLLNVLDLPGLKSSLRRITDDVIASFVVLPNRVAVPLAAGVDASDLQYPIPEGVLRVKVVEAKDLIAKDIGFVKKGKSDPYAIIRIGAQSFRTKMISNDLNPEWNETFEAFVDNSEGQELEAVIYDEDTSSKDSKIGRLDTEIVSTVETGYQDLWLPLEGVKQGRVHLQLNWFPLSANASDLEPPQGGGLSVAALIVKPISADALPLTSGQKEALRSVYCEITVGKTTLQTFQCYGEKTEWKQALRFLVSDPGGQEAEVKVIEAKGTKTLGKMSFDIRKLLSKDGLTVEETFPLKESGEKSTLTCRFTLRVLNTPDVNPSEPETRSKAEVDAGLTKPEIPLAHSTPIPKLVINGVNPEEQAEAGEEHDKDSDAGSVYDGSIYGSESQRTDSNDDLTNKGQLDLHLKYSHLKNCLSVTVKSVRELVSRDSPGKTNPLVRLYLLPDRSKRSRRVTRVMKGTLNCVFNETFEYMIGLDQLGTMKIDVAVKSDRGFAIGRVRHRLIGLAVVDLSGKHLTEGCDVSCELRKFSLTF